MIRNAMIDKDLQNPGGGPFNGAIATVTGGQAICQSACSRFGRKNGGNTAMMRLRGLKTGGK